MKKLLLFALAAIASLTASAQTPTMISDSEWPQGTQMGYTRMGACTFPIKKDGKTSIEVSMQPDTLSTSVMAFDADGQTVYLRNPISALNMGKWIKGTISGNTLQFPVGQFIAYSEEGKWGYTVYMLKSEGDGLKIDDTVQNITYTMSPDKKKITLEGSSSKPMQGIGVVYSDTKGWVGYLDLLITYNFDQKITDAATATAGVESIDSDANENEIKSITYFDASGKQITVPTKGMTIKKITYTNGKQKTAKFISK